MASVGISPREAISLRQHSRRSLLGCVLSGGAALLRPLRAVGDPDGFPWQNGQTVLFLGDSITYHGGYVQYVETFLRARYPERRIGLLNLGLPSETCTGLSEPEHPFPRPNVHERLDRALAKVRPDWVVLCYGMNDGIYYPYSEERFQQYRKGILSAVEKVRKLGARPIVMTPSAFDPSPLGARALPDGAPRYSWMTPYAGYDGVLARYSAWLVSQRTHELPVVDCHTAVNRALQALRQGRPDFALASDGVHVGAAGQALLAFELLTGLGAEPTVDSARLDYAARKTVRGRLTEIAYFDGGLRFRWQTRLPFPQDPDWPGEFARIARLRERLNRHEIAVTGLPPGRYSLCEGDTVRTTVDAEALSAGVDLTAIGELSTNRDALELLAVVRRRERLLSPAWLTHVGHLRPMTPTGLPLGEARAQASPLDARIHELSRPLVCEITLRRSA